MALDWTPKFLASLSASPNVTEACRAAGISRMGAYKRRNQDEEFAASWDDALEQSTDALIGEMYRRAFKGCERNVYYRGDVCGKLVEYSDTLAIFLAKAHRPEVYGDKLRQEVATSGEITIVHELCIPDNGRDPAPEN